MINIFSFFLCRMTFLINIFVFMPIVPILSMDTTEDPRIKSIRTIKILPNKDDTLTVGSETFVFNENEDSQYTNAFGRNNIFKLIATNQWQRSAAIIAMSFEDAIEKIGIGQNYIFVSLSIGVNAEVHKNIPHLFFSGNAEKVYDQVFINTSDILRRFSPQDEKQNVSSANMNSSVIRNTFLQPNDVPSDYAKERTLEFMVEKCFPDMFYGFDQMGFFVFPIHQVPLIDKPLLHETKSQKSGKNTSEENQVNCLEIEPDILTCKFRDFIYSSFTEGKEKEIEEHIQNEDLDLMLQILNNVITHAKDNSNSQAIPTTQRSIMRSVLAERYVRQNPYSVNILKEVFDLTNFDDVFGKTGRESHEPTETMSAMSNCFLHSEQSFLKMMLQLHKINVIDFIISHVYERFEKIIVGSSETSPVALCVAGKDGLDDDVPDDYVADGEIEGADNDEKEDDTAAKGPRIENQKKVLQFTFEEPIIIDIISPRHICKFCRGSLHLRCNDIQQLLGKNIVIDPMNEKILTEPYKDKFDKILDMDTQKYIMGENKKSKNCINNKPSSETHERLYPICKKRRNEKSEFSQFASNYEKFMLHKMLTHKYSECAVNNIFNIELIDVNIQIFATSFKNAKDSIMGIQ